MTPEASGSNEDLSTHELILAQTAFYLDEKGDPEAAALLLEAESIEMDPYVEEWGWTNRAFVNVPGWAKERFTDEIIDRIHGALRAISKRYDISVESVIIGAALPPVDRDWRQSLYARLSGDSVTNHARRVKPDQRLSRDGFLFESLEEIKVYDALKRAQATLSNTNATNTITIFPLPMGRLGAGSVLTPDFLVIREGKVGLIEVDGPHHRGRYGADATRDRLWKYGGVIHIERILVEETTQDDELDQLIRAFLARLKRA
ncbi:hypothetical protein GCM10023194_58670 [Planotetraspora phitsanulokensis]|uniref:DUF559 domain-containing protein n=1 Tax=Planotetraspora phitsanulokensis TaxID=575192 RepID=A0A8J3U833_9ACTN|nr:hypothetical protein [Planotetraspora phitsanulokensis]GII40328.1 hypothetical protein Pph01_53310 [Planotetraspora phitsanulokensis]